MHINLEIALALALLAAALSASAGQAAGLHALRNEGRRERQRDYLFLLATFRVFGERVEAAVRREDSALTRGFDDCPAILETGPGDYVPTGDLLLPFQRATAYAVVVRRAAWLDDRLARHAFASTRGIVLRDHLRQALVALTPLTTRSFDFCGMLTACKKRRWRPASFPLEFLGLPATFFDRLERIMDPITTRSLYDDAVNVGTDAGPGSCVASERHVLQSALVTGGRLHQGGDASTAFGSPLTIGLRSG